MLALKKKCGRDLPVPSFIFELTHSLRIFVIRPVQKAIKEIDIKR